MLLFSIVIGGGLPDRRATPVRASGGASRHRPHREGELGLDDTGVRDGRPCSLCWVYVHMIEEYSRHNGHADLLRELVDGTVGW